MTDGREILDRAGAQTVDSPEEATTVVAWPYRGQSLTSVFYLEACDEECGARVVLLAANRDRYADKPIVCIGCALKGTEE